MRLFSSVLLITGLLCTFILAQENPVKSGNYLIRYCGAGPGSKAAQLQSLLPGFWDDLQLVISDARRGNASSAYRAFFKSQQSAAYVERIFRNMADGVPVQTPISGAPSRFTRPLYPYLPCLDATVPNVDTLYAVCSQKAASIVPQREIMILCPPFWTMKSGPERLQCPGVSRNKFVPDDFRVMYNQFGSFVHEFAHAYIQDWGTAEKYSPMEAVQLSANASLKNANNFALYASMIMAGCPKYVNPNTLQDKDRELLEDSQKITDQPAPLSSMAAAAPSLTS